MNTLAQPKAAVAVVHHFDSNSVLLIRRPQNPKDPWSGHLAFPGGRIEEKDPTILDTAIRETYEETGLKLTQKQFKRKLHIGYAGRTMQALIAVQPFLFSLRGVLPIIKPDPKEVADYYWLNLEEFSQIERHTTQPLAKGVPNETMPCFAIDNFWLWGFTYQILLKEFVSI